MEMFKKKSDYLIAGLIFAIIGLLLVVSFDALFSPPDHLEGQIVEKILVPAHTVSGGPYGGIEGETTRLPRLLKSSG